MHGEGAGISTHAAHEGAASSAPTAPTGSPYFNSRGPRRGRGPTAGAPSSPPSFQLTRPTKGPRGGDGNATQKPGFQLTRPTKGPRITSTTTLTVDVISTHAAHEGAATHGCPVFVHSSDFNSRGPRRGRGPRWRSLKNGQDFNSRGPRRGRARHCPTYLRITLFQLTRPTKGPRVSIWWTKHIVCISTHAAHEGAAWPQTRLRGSSQYFNSRGPRRGRASRPSTSPRRPTFQLTRPTKGPRSLSYGINLTKEFQLTRPTKGPRTATGSKEQK